MDGEPAGAGEITRLLREAAEGDSAAVDRVYPLVYEELRRLARAQLHRVGGPATLTPTALVHEAYLKLGGGSPLAAENRTHFIRIAARAMRQVLVDQARQRKAHKRGGDLEPVTLLEGHRPLQVDFTDMLALDEAIASLDPRQREIVIARFFGGLEEREIAELMEISERTVRREWVKARAWLVRALLPSVEPSPPAG